MGKRDKNRTFNNPFEALKGLSVSAAKAAPNPPKVNSAAPVKHSERESESTFDQAMEQLGVRRIEPGDEPLRPAQGDARAVKAEEGAGPPCDNAPRKGKRLVQVQRGRLHPEAELDLHGLTVAQAMPKVSWFLENALFHGCEVVRIVTGRGKTSPGEAPVLKPQVAELLCGSLRDKVLEWDEAPKSLGGEGALIVVLRMPDAGEG